MSDIFHVSHEQMRSAGGSLSIELNEPEMPGASRFYDIRWQPLLQNQWLFAREQRL